MPRDCPVRRRIVYQRVACGFMSERKTHAAQIDPTRREPLSGDQGWPPGVTRPGARAAHTVVALVAGAGYLLAGALNAAGAYGPQPEVEGNVYGDNADGLAGAFGRLADHVSYFTEWSNAVVALAFGLLALRPGLVTQARRVLLLSSLLMITVTAIVYRVLLAPTQVVEGWSVLTNPWQHVLVPVLAVGVWLVWGPRDWVTLRLVPWALVIPTLWIAWALIRGLIVGSYPYGFIDARTYGYAAVFTTIGAILAFALVLAILLWAIEALLRRRQGAGATP